MVKSVFRRPKMAVIRFVHCLGLPVEDNTLVLASYIPLILTYTDRLVCGAGSVKRYGVRQSVRPSNCLFQHVPTAANPQQAANPLVMDMYSCRPMGASVARLIILVLMIWRTLLRTLICVSQPVKSHEIFRQYYALQTWRSWKM